MGLKFAKIRFKKIEACMHISDLDHVLHQESVFLIVAQIETIEVRS